MVCIILLIYLLFLKKINNSYINLNTVYKYPKEYNSLIFLIRILNNWNILDIEIYSINYIFNEEFFNNSFNIKILI